MKKLLLLLVLFLPLTLPAQISKPGHRVSLANNFNTLNAEELLFTNIHWARESFGWNNSTVAGAPTGAIATNGQTVGKLNNKKGSIDVTYGGTWTPTIYSTIPTLIDDNWLTFINRPTTIYSSSTFTQISPPFEMWHVFRLMPGQRFEELFAGGDNAGLIGELASVVRIINASTDYIVPGSSLPTMYQIHLCRLVVNNNNTADWWLDGTYIGSVTFTDPADFPNKVKKSVITVGVNSNVEDYDWAASYFYNGNFSSGTATTIYNSLAAKWAVGTFYPLQLTFIRWDRSSSTYTPSATVAANTTGKTLNAQTLWNYEWFWYDNASNLTTQTLFSSNRVVTTADFPSDYLSRPGFRIKVIIQPTFTDASVGRKYEGTYGDYFQITTGKQSITW